MRSKLIGFLLGCGLAVAIVAPTFACDYTSAANDSQQRQTAQAQPTPNSSTQ